MSLSQVAMVLVLSAAAPGAAEWLPERLGEGSRDGAPATYDRQTVFEYMDGKAEVYLRYAFRELTVADYRVGGQKVAVLLFDMTTPAEAYGIYSTTAEGEALDLLQGARYQDGTFRGWQGRIFLKLEGEADAPELRAFAHQVARHLAAGLEAREPLPALAAALPRDRLKLRDMRYFHEQETLDAIYYVATDNVLALSGDTAALFADGELDGQALKVLVVQYPTVAAREQAWAGFVGKVLSPRARAAGGHLRYEELEPNLFAGLRRAVGPRNQPRLLFCLEAGSARSCLQVLELLAGQSAKG